MKKIVLLLISFTVIMLTGCAQPVPFNKDIKRIVFREGIPYLVPKEELNVALIKKEMLEFSKRYRLPTQDCKIGDIRWMEWNAYKSLDAEFKRLNSIGTDIDIGMQMIASRMIELINSDLTGCSKAMSDKEYQYYLANEGTRQRQAQFERSENAAAVSSFNQNMNNVSNQIRQNTYNTEQSTYQIQQLNNQMYQQRQDRQRNMQMQQINNNLNGIRYGY